MSRKRKKCMLKTYIEIAEHTHTHACMHIRTHQETPKKKSAYLRLTANLSTATIEAGSGRNLTTQNSLSGENIFHERAQTHSRTNKNRDYITIYITMKLSLKDIIKDRC